MEVVLKPRTPTIPSTWCHAKAREEKGEIDLGRLIRGQIKAWQDGIAKWMVYVARWK